MSEYVAELFFDERPEASEIIIDNNDGPIKMTDCRIASSIVKCVICLFLFKFKIMMLWKQQDVTL